MERSTITKRWITALCLAGMMAALPVPFASAGEVSPQMVMGVQTGPSLDAQTIQHAVDDESLNKRVVDLNLPVRACGAGAIFPMMLGMLGGGVMRRRGPAQGK